MQRLVIYCEDPRCGHRIDAHARVPGMQGRSAWCSAPGCGCLEVRCRSREVAPSSRCVALEAAAGRWGTWSANREQPPTTMQNLGDAIRAIEGVPDFAAMPLEDMRAHIGHDPPPEWRDPDGVYWWGRPAPPPLR